MDSLTERVDDRMPRWLQGPREVVSSVLQGFGADDVLGTAAELSFRWLLAVFPLAIVTAALAGFISGALQIDDPTDQLIAAVGSAMPPETADTLRPQIERVLGSRNGGLLSLGLALSVYAASGGIRALFKALNRAYGVDESRPVWRQYLLAVGLTLLVGTATIAAFLMLTGGRLLIERLARDSVFGDLVTAALGPITAILTVMALAGAIAVLYRLAPARRPSWRGVVPGVVLFVPAWLAATFGFSLYIENFGSYADTYGALAGVIILLLWFYLSSIILLLGGELNAVLERRARDEQLPREDGGTRGDA